MGIWSKVMTFGEANMKTELKSLHIKPMCGFDETKELMSSIKTNRITRAT